MQFCIVSTANGPFRNKWNLDLDEISWVLHSGSSWDAPYFSCGVHPASAGVQLHPSGVYPALAGVHLISAGVHTDSACVHHASQSGALQDYPPPPLGGRYLPVGGADERQLERLRHLARAVLDALQRALEEPVQVRPDHRRHQGADHARRLKQRVSEGGAAAGGVRRCQGAGWDGAGRDRAGKGQGGGGAGRQGEVWCGLRPQPETVGVRLGWEHGGSLILTESAGVGWSGRDGAEKGQWITLTG